MIPLVTALALLVIGAALLASYWTTNSSSEDIRGGTTFDSSQSLASMAAQQALGSANIPHRAVRVVYPYSIVPGGARDSRELLAATAHDPVAARHYAGFDFGKARVVELQQSKLVYLSYRMHDKIYWTRKKVALHKGEK